MVQWAKIRKFVVLYKIIGKKKCIVIVDHFLYKNPRPTITLKLDYYYYY